MNNDMVLSLVVMNTNLHVPCYQVVFYNDNYLLSHITYIFLFAYLDIVPEGCYNCIRICSGTL